MFVRLLISYQQINTISHIHCNHPVFVTVADFEILVVSINQETSNWYVIASIGYTLKRKQGSN
jgi:hypothetical protein